MKPHKPQVLPTQFLASILASLAGLSLGFWSSVAQAQPSISDITPDGTIQFQGQAPSPNTLTFGVSSGTGVTSLSVKLTATTLPGVVTVSTLTPGNGMTVTGPNTGETATIPLANDVAYNAVITASDSSGPVTVAKTFDTISRNYYTFEAEDFNYTANGVSGLFIDNPGVGVFNVNAYMDLLSTEGIDYHSGNPGSGNSNYRPQGLETENAGDIPRQQYSGGGPQDYDIGYNNGGNWGNYTRTYPAGVYNIYARLASPSGQNNCGEMSLVTGAATSNQTATVLGTFSVPNQGGWQTYGFVPCLDSGNMVAWATPGDVETLRFTVVGGNCNENFYMLVPAVPVLTPNIPNTFQGNPATLNVDGKALQAVNYQWQSDNGTGGATWTAISGATNSTYTVPTATLSGTYQFRVIVANNALSEPTAPVALTINPSTKPLIVQNTTPSSETTVVGTISTFTATFQGNLPIGYQWLVSSNGGLTFSPLTGQTNTTLQVANLAVVTNIEYALQATNAFGATTSAPASLTVVAAPPRPPLQLAGELIVALQESDLAANITVWTNRAGSSANVGDFRAPGGALLNVPASTPSWGATPVNALFVNNSGANVVQSGLQAPAGIIQANPVSVEAWIYATAISGNNTVVGYGNQGGGGAPYQDREFDYGGGGNGAFSGNFGGDFGWKTTPSPDAWHYLAWTYDGSTVIAYTDGNADNTNANQTMNTVESLIVVGGGIASAGPGIADTFSGYIASARVSSGVLTADQVSNNFQAGLQGVIPVILYAPIASPTNLVTKGTPVVLTLHDQEAYPFSYQWQTDNGSGGATWTTVSGATNTTLDVSTTALSVGNYEYEVVLMNAAYGLAVTSSPVVLTVSAAVPPAIVQDTTPASATVYVTASATFSALFTGAVPLNLQWQVSTDGTHFTFISGATGTNLTVVNEVPATNYYRLYAANAYGTNSSTPAQLIVLPAPALPPAGTLQTAGDVIVNLQSTDLAPGVTQWINATVNSNSVGNFTTPSNAPLNVTASTPAYLYHNINALFVDQQVSKALQSTLMAPTGIIANNPVSIEGWIYAIAVNQQNSSVVGYGMQGQSAVPQADREFNYEANYGSGSTSGDFGNFDSPWSTTPAPGAWHYLAWAWDGTTVNCYLDGNFDHSQTPGSPLVTPESLICIGGGPGQSGSGPGVSVDPFQGYIAAVRVESGVLTADQVSANYTAGLFGTVPTSVYPQPLRFSFANGALTLTWGAGATLKQAPSLQGPWTTVNVSSPYVVTPVSGGKIAFYRLQY